VSFVLEEDKVIRAHRCILAARCPVRGPSPHTHTWLSRALSLSLSQHTHTHFSLGRGRFCGPCLSREWPRAARK
jgi:hypothetical protein